MKMTKAFVNLLNQTHLNKVLSEGNKMNIWQMYRMSISYMQPQNYVLDSSFWKEKDENLEI